MKLENFNTSGKYIKLLQEKDKIFEDICPFFEQWELPVFLIGGYVRDFLLDRPTKDIDIVTLGDGIELANSKQII